MKLLFVNSGDKSLVKYVLNHIKKLSQGTWFLLWVTVDGVIQKNCGYIVFKDKRPVLFYTNDLKETPTKRIQGVNEESVRCVGGLLILKRWTDECTTTSKSFYVPSIIVAYNHLMNVFDIFDQVRTYSACVRKEKRVSMTILDFILDSSLQNAYSILSVIDLEEFKSINFREFKRQVAVSLTGYKSKKIINNPVTKGGGCESINLLLSKEK